MGEDAGLVGQVLAQVGRNLLDFVAGVAEEQRFVAGPSRQGSGEVGEAVQGG